MRAAAAAVCPATAPDNWQIGCDHQAGHPGPHRSNMVIWNEPSPPDLATNTKHWVDGEVLLTGEESSL